MKCFVNGDEYDFDPSAAQVIRSGDRFMVRTREGTFSAMAVRDGDAILISYKGHQFRVESRRKQARTGIHVGSGELRAPMPGLIVDIKQKKGAKVTLGETVIVLEAMKTQQPILSPFAGTLSQIVVSVGNQVVDGALLAVVEPTENSNE